MRTVHRSVICAAATCALAIAPLALAQQQPQQPQQRQATQDQTQQGAILAVGEVTPAQPIKFPAGFTAQSVDDAEDIRETLADVTEAALTRGGFDDLVERLVDQDRNRLGRDGFASREFADLDGRIAQLQKAFQDKYGSEFNIDNEEAVFDARYSVAQGEVTDPAAILNNWPVPATPARMQRGTGDAMTRTPGATEADQARLAADAAANGTADRNAAERAVDATGRAIERTAEGVANATVGTETAEEAANLERGRDVAIVGLPQIGKASTLHVSLIQEVPDQWRIDTPNRLTGPELKENLMRHLTFVGERVNDWPANADDAKRMISHHVLMALYGVNPSAGGGMGGMQPNQPNQQPQGGMNR